MECGMVLTHLKVQPGECITVKGMVPPDAKSFALNLGRAGSDLALHFNPRFESQGDTCTIICNSLQGRTWGEEQREPEFPFQQGQETKICISFDAQELTVGLPGQQQLKFPNRLGLEAVEFFSVEGDFRVKSLKFK
ncbi:16 kDa beta-galactoside-binding lectin-like [Emydura macquarii macquarii]|uniref:16 kDa beta-galactoside-binding lectin-like n=1 Tax=Emydura macquarii macquarii TaxID=1129001 RepID=UPI00352A0595